MNTINIISKIEKYALILGIIGIFAGIWIPLCGWISIFMIGITYITALMKQKIKSGKIQLISLLLCIASLLWLILRQFTSSPYMILFGQITVYAYLMNTQKNLLGHIDKKFLAFACCAVAVGLGTAAYPCKITNIANILMQIWILYRFVDPVLEKIGQAHRAKRLAALQQEEEEKCL